MKYDAKEEFRAAKADLVTLPDDMKVDNCTNCKYVAKDYCVHPKMDLPLVDGAEHMCCSYWDAKGVKHWGKE